MRFRLSMTTTELVSHFYRTFYQESINKNEKEETSAINPNLLFYYGNFFYYYYRFSDT